MWHTHFKERLFGYVLKLKKTVLLHFHQPKEGNNHILDMLMFNNFYTHMLDGTSFKSLIFTVTMVTQNVCVPVNKMYVLPLRDRSS